MNHHFEIGFWATMFVAGMLVACFGEQIDRFYGWMKEWHRDNAP